MARNRFFAENIKDEVTLSGEEFHHAKYVLRLFEGSEVTLLDGSGAEYCAIVSKVEKSRMILRVIKKRESDSEPVCDVCLFIGALKGDKTELVVQKATELGVNKIGVFSSAFCAAYFNDNKLERLKRVAREAAKQCMRATVPQISYFETLKDALESADGYRNKFFACEFSKNCERDLLPVQGSCALVVGSEGGFRREELEEAKFLGFSEISLGRRILRAETAAIALLSVVMYGLGELK